MDHLLSNESKKRHMRPWKQCRKHINSGLFLASTCDIGSSGQFVLSALVEKRNNNTGLVFANPEIQLLYSLVLDRKRSLGENQLAGNQLALKSCIVSSTDRHMG